MAKQKHHGVMYSDLKTNDWNALQADLDDGTTDQCILDNRKSGTGKAVLVKMSPDLGQTYVTWDEGYLAAGWLSLPNVGDLGYAFNCFEIGWQIGTLPWNSLGVSAPPGQYFKVIGVAWDEHDVPALITRVAS